MKPDLSSRARRRAPVRRALIALITGELGGCATSGAPSFALFGAYFPDWMLIALIGIIAAAVARVVMVSTGLADLVPAQLLTCTSIGVTAAILVWLVWFAR